VRRAGLIALAALGALTGLVLAFIGGRIVLLDVALAALAIGLRMRKASTAAPLAAWAAVVAIALIPQSLFLVWFNAGFRYGIEPSALPHAVALYEGAVIGLHDVVKQRLTLAPLAAVAVSLALLVIATWSHERIWMRGFAAYRRWFGRLALGLLAASSFTLLAPVGSGGWTPDLPRRIDGLLRREASEEARAGVGRALISQKGDQKILKSLVATAEGLAKPDPPPCDDDSATDLPLIQARPAPEASVSAGVRQDPCPVGKHERLWLEDRDAAATGADRRQMAYEVVTQFADDLIQRIVDRAPAADASPHVLLTGGDAPSLALVRAAAARAVSARTAAEAIVDQAKEVFTPALPSTGNDLADSFLDHVRDTYLGAAIKRAYDWLIARAERHGAAPLLDADFASVCAATARSFLHTEITEGARIKLKAAFDKVFAAREAQVAAERARKIETDRDRLIDDARGEVPAR
jgi:hypothetical protein